MVGTHYWVATKKTVTEFFPEHCFRHDFQSNPVDHLTVCLVQLLRTAQDLKATGWAFTIEASIVQIEKDGIVDLLGHDAEGRRATLINKPQGIDDNSLKSVPSSEEADGLMISEGCTLPQGMRRLPISNVRHIRCIVQHAINVRQRRHNATQASSCIHTVYTIALIGMALKSLIISKGEMYREAF